MSQLLPDLESAMDRLIKERPGIFDLSNEYAPGTRAYKVLNKDAYMDGLVATLVAAGLCAERDVDDPEQQTIRVKDSNEFSEDFDVLLDKASFIRRGTGSYAATCTPPNFPANQTAGRASRRQRLLPAVPASALQDELQGLPERRRSPRDRLDAAASRIPPTARPSASRTGAGSAPSAPTARVDRVACENWRRGHGEGHRQGRSDLDEEARTAATAPDKESGCVNSPDSQYQLWVYTARLCTRVSANKGDVKSCDAYVDR